MFFSMRASAWHLGGTRWYVQAVGSVAQRAGSGAV